MRFLRVQAFFMIDDVGLPLFAIVLGLLASLALATTADASPCSDASAARQITRSIGAIRRAEWRRRCRGGGYFSGYFDGCRNLAYQREQLARDLAYLKLSATSCGRNDDGRTGARRRNRPEHREEAGRGDRGSSRNGAGASPASSGGVTRMYCVREADGYFFPAPNSQFAGPDSYDETRARCRFICDDARMDVYFLPNASDETDGLVAIRDQSAYSALPTAYRYQKAKDFKSCDMQRYYRRMQAIERAGAEPAREAVAPESRHPDVSAVIVIPKPRPERLADGSFPATGADVSADHRRVRIVGTPLLPAMRELAESMRR